jgi:hypothetical protein
MATDTPATPPLRCLGGLPAPPEIVADLAALPALPLPARRHFYRVLGPCLEEPVPATVDAKVAEFCAEHAADGAAVTRAIKASRFFVRHAALVDLGEAEMAEDLAKLDPGGEIVDTLMPGYEIARKLIRSEVARGTIFDHGKVVERVAWRVEQVTSSNRGQNLGFPMVALTLAYREGDRTDRITFQLLPEALQELQAMCQRLL